MIAGANFYPADAVTFSMAEQRAFYNRYCVHFRKTRPPTVETNDLRIAGVPCRHYARQGASAAPLLIYLHGGGFVLGGLDSHDDVCAEICDAAGIEVVAVDYRLAPEHPFPAAFEDGWAVLQELGKRTAASSLAATVPAAIWRRPWRSRRAMPAARHSPARC